MGAFEILVLLVLYVLFSAVFYPLPIGDAMPMRYGSLPWITGGLILANVCIFVFLQYPDIQRVLEAETRRQRDAALAIYLSRSDNYVSSALAIRTGTGIGAVSTFTGMFTHGSFLHLTGNMIFLWVFGRRVEDACGAWRFLLFYLFAGVVSKMTYYILIAEQGQGSLGASGAIAGVMGAYMILFPGVQLRCLWVALTIFSALRVGFLRFIGSRVGHISWTVAIPAYLLIVPFIGSDLLATFDAAETRELTSGINYVAHAGGFLSAVTILLFVRKDVVTRYFAGRSLK